MNRLRNKRSRPRFTGRMSVGLAYAAVLTALVLGLLLSTDRLVDTASSKPLGPERDRWLAIAEPLDSFAKATRLDRPSQVVNGWLGREGDASDTLDTATTTPQSPTFDTTTDPGSGQTTAPATTTTMAPTTTTTQYYRPLSPAAPLEVWAAGDSLGEYIGQELKAIAGQSDLGEVALDYRISTGLARPDYFDWPTHVNDQLALENPVEVLVFMVGGNDDQPMRTDGENLRTLSPEWVAEYQLRAAQLMDTAESGGAFLIWIGLPPMQDEQREAIAREINRVVRDEAERHDRTSYFDPAELLLEGDETYSEYVTSPDGELSKARLMDGIHITREASHWIAQAIWDEMLTVWPIEPPPTTTTTTPATTTTTTTTLP